MIRFFATIPPLGFALWLRCVPLKVHDPLESGQGINAVLNRPAVREPGNVGNLEHLLCFRQREERKLPGSSTASSLFVGAAVT